jgi:hypothetical protein
MTETLMKVTGKKQLECEDLIIMIEPGKQCQEKDALKAGKSKSRSFNKQLLKLGSKSKNNANYIKETVSIDAYKNGIQFRNRAIY